MHINNKTYQRHKRLIDNLHRMVNSIWSFEVNENFDRRPGFKSQQILKGFLNKKHYVLPSVMLYIDHEVKHKMS